MTWGLLFASLVLAASAAGLEQAVETAPVVVESPAPAKPDAQPAAPVAKCTIKPVTGSRLKKQRVCRTPEYEKAGERDRDAARSFFDRAGNIQPTLPPGAGG